jgi:Pregnancy-associated plasma protein-A/Secretion system C-terminal sorting domain
MRSILLLSVFIFTLLGQLTAQRSCIISEVLQSPSVMTETGTQAPSPDIIIIPVVVHVVFNTPEQNISNDQVRSQITSLNNDFRKKNKDASHIPAAFRDLAADARIEFRLATIDPSGLPTNGIIRKSTHIAGFGTNEDIKSSSTGGDDGWDPDQYLNLWVGNLSGGVMGYASAPGCEPHKDGVVIRYNVFGTTPNVKAPFNKGRTAVHEIGHWLGLRHIWGDAACGDDRIDDTPPQEGPTRGCPSGIISTCSSGTAGNMYMNFMDFTNDECTNMFTRGQAEKMRELFQAGGQRVALLSSDKADGAQVVGDEAATTDVQGISLFPNPAVNELNIRFSSNSNQNGSQVIIYNHLGQTAKRFIVTKEVMQVDIKNLKGGIYYIFAGGSKVHKFIKAG